MEDEKKSEERREKTTRQVSSAIYELRNNFSYGNMASVFKDEISEVKRAERSKLKQVLLFFWEIVRASRNPWYYWYTGSRMVAIQAWIVSFIVMLVVAVSVTGGDIFKALIYVLIGVALESIALIAIPLAFLIDLKFSWIPDDWYPDLIVPVLISGLGAFVLNRLSVFIVLHSQRF